jgi:LPXTG-site transpeptidase (sortase) family protein
MKSLARKLVVFLLLVSLLSEFHSPNPVLADNSISLTALGTTYYQNFDTLSSSSESNVLPPGWVLAEAKANSNNIYTPSTGNLKTGDTYSFGSVNSSDRALGGIQDDNLLPLFGASFTNNTGGIITSIDIEYTGEQWRSGYETRADKIKFEFSSNATSLTDGTWNPYSDLDFITPDTSKVGAKDGNAPANRRVLQYTITNLSINPGESFWIRWTDHPAYGDHDDDGLAVDDFSLTPFGIDNTPILLAITPVDNATHVSLDSNLSITFSEPVNLMNGWLSLSCSNSNQHIVSISGGPQTYTIDPVNDFAYDDVCTVTITAAKVTDQDTIDPPDTLDRNYSYSFAAMPTPDSAPVVIGIFPENNDSAVSLDTNLTVKFSEPVTVSPNWFSLTCTSSGVHPATVTGGPSIFVLKPQNAFSYDENCTLNVNAQEVSDMDDEDPPDLMLLDASVTFSTLPTPDTEPFIQASKPENNTLSVPTNQIIEITFNEPVTLDQRAIEITCESIDAFTYTLSGGPLIFKLTPDQDLPFGDRCSVKISALSVADIDIDDPPDNMLMDQIINFETASDPGTPPHILETMPAEGAAEVAIDSNITITFSKNVLTTDPWAELNCSKSGDHSFVTGGTSSIIEINPDQDFDNNESCQLTIIGSQIHNQDTVDPAGGMAENYVLTFSTAALIDQPPSLIDVNPPIEGIGVPVDKNFSFTFSEPVELLIGWIDFSCTKGGKYLIFTEGGPIKYTIGSDRNLEYSETCTVTLNGEKIIDLDTDDPPDFLSSNSIFRFSTVKSPDELAAPTIVNDITITPHDNQILHESLNHLVVQFSKDVLHDGTNDAANNPQNYRLLEWGTNHIFDTTTCENTIGDDKSVSIQSINYEAATFKADLIVNYGVNLPDGTYRLIICGENTIRDLFGTPLNDGLNSTINFTIDSAGNDNGTGSGGNTPGNGINPVIDTNSLSSMNVYASGFPLIPVTGFSPGRVTLLAPQQTAYTNIGKQLLEIPVLNLETSITGVPKENGNWDVTWLGRQAGWLEGSAQLGDLGNAVLTAHVWDALNQPGPFYGLEKLKYGDQVILHAWGEEYVYEVREVLSVQPENVKAMMKHQEKAWLTLVTCQGYDENSGEYLNRILVRAVLMEIR